ncbi:MAG TPA: PEP-CTERM sorting domain-containing protein [Bryobacteraceae bacterium]
MNRLIVVLAAIGILARIASAVPITYVETTTATGTLGGTAFTSASVTVTLVGDTSNITSGPSPFGAYLINPGLATIKIGALPIATFTDLVEIIGSDNQATPSIFSMPFVLIATLDNPAGTSITGVVDEYGDPAFLGYGLTALGPISATGSSASGAGGPHNTSSGVLLFSSDNSPQPATFTATVGTPEPTSVILLGTGLLALVGLSLRRKLA